MLFYLISSGTTYSCVGYYDKDSKKVEIIPNELGNRCTASYIGFDDEGIILVGDAAKNQAIENPYSTIFDVKRLIGRSYNDPELTEDKKYWPFNVTDIDGKPQVQIKIKSKDKVFSPEQLSSFLLGKLKKIAESKLGCAVNDAVITVPAYFNDNQRQATKLAAEIAELNVVQIQNEPTAGAFAYDLNTKEEKKIAIYDFGGGTLDITILHLSNNGNFNVITTHGDTHLGGNDFDTSIMSYFVEKFKKKHKIDLLKVKDKRALQKLRKEAERVKILLSLKKQVDYSIEPLFNGINFSGTFTRLKFEEISSEILKKAGNQMLDKVLEKAKFKKSDIDEVVLIGGTTRMPMVRKLVGDYFYPKVPHTGLNPDEAVAYGASILGGIKRNNLIGFKLNDVTSHSYGIEVYDTDTKTTGHMSVVVPLNSLLPINVTETFFTAFDSQTTIAIVVFEGEKPTTVDNFKLGQFDLTFSKQMPKKSAVDVTFQVDESGIMNVKAVDQSNRNNVNQITIKRGSASTISAIDKAAMAKENKEFLDSELKKFEEISKLRSSLNNLILDYQFIIGEPANSIEADALTFLNHTLKFLEGSNLFDNKKAELESKRVEVEDYMNVVKRPSSPKNVITKGFTSHHVSRKENEVCFLINFDAVQSKFKLKTTQYLIEWDRLLLSSSSNFSTTKANFFMMPVNRNLLSDNVLAKSICSSHLNIYVNYALRITAFNEIGGGVPSALQVCSTGFFYSSINNICLACPVGKFCLFGSSEPSVCSLPASGYYTKIACSSTTDTQTTQCSTPSNGRFIAKSCIAGTETEVGTDSEIQICSTTGTNSAYTLLSHCVRGTYSIPGSNAAFLCSVGYYGNATFRNYGTLTGCEKCPIGNHCFGGFSKPVKCPIGNYCFGGVQTPCASGTYQPNTGQTSCLPCVAGYYCLSGSFAGTACSGGSWSTASASSLSSCYSCPSGYSCSNGVRSQCAAGSYSVGGRSSCTPCPIGYYCVAGSFAAAICPSGTYGASLFLVSQSLCTTCPSGSFCSSGSAVQCSAGFYSGTGQSTCTACASGSYSSSGASICTSCPIGSYCVNGILTLCSAGTFSSSTGASLCSTCPPGSSCASGATSATMCAVGFYSSSGASSCTTCPSGTYSSSGASICSSCPSGSYCVNGLLSSCAAGTYQSSTGQSACTTCPAGAYCSGGSQTPCVPGTYQPSTGQTSCLPCVAGFYCLSGASSLTPCPINNYCDSETSIPIPCSNHTKSEIWSLSCRNLTFIGMLFDKEDENPDVFVPTLSPIVLLFFGIIFTYTFGGSKKSVSSEDASIQKVASSKRVNIANNMKGKEHATMIRDLLKKAKNEPQKISFCYLAATANNFKEKLIGSGGVADVYKCYIDGYGWIAIKKVKASLNETIDLRNYAKKSFDKEISFLSKLRHPNFIKLLGYSIPSELPSSNDFNLCLVYEYALNSSLDQIFRNDLVCSLLLPWQKRIEIAYDIARAIKYLHEGEEKKGGLHRDIKSGNIVLTENLVPKLIDWGLSRWFPENNNLHSAHSTSSFCAGTRGYKCESYSETGEYDVTCEVFSFGVVLAELLTGKLTNELNMFKEFPDGRKKQLFLNHVIETYPVDPRTSSYGEFFPEECIVKFRTLAINCMKKWEDRIKNMKIVVEELEEIKNEFVDKKNSKMELNFSSEVINERTKMTFTSFKDNGLESKTQFILKAYQHAKFFEGQQKCFNRTYVECYSKFENLLQAAWIFYMKANPNDNKYVNNNNLLGYAYSLKQTGKMPIEIFSILILLINNKNLIEESSEVFDKEKLLERLEKMIVIIKYYFPLEKENVNEE